MEEKKTRHRVSISNRAFAFAFPPLSFHLVTDGVVPAAPQKLSFERIYGMYYSRRIKPCVIMSDLPPMMVAQTWVSCFFAVKSARRVDFISSVAARSVSSNLLYDMIGITLPLQ